MTEAINDKKNKSKKAKQKVDVEIGAVEIEALEGFTPEEVARMSKIKQRIGAGEFTDITDEYKKLLFVQWLIEHEKIRS